MAAAHTACSARFSFSHYLSTSSKRAGNLITLRQRRRKSARSPPMPACRSLSIKVKDSIRALPVFTRYSEPLPSLYD